MSAAELANLRNLVQQFATRLSHLESRVADLEAHAPRPDPRQPLKPVHIDLPPPIPLHDTAAPTDPVPP